ncbi:kinase-like protein [Exidia glandulosa HHB12029]|uniref:Kinase-like protein n=1 Tax=Exidia glandulosa HHB12029 TaxID=1314781 RepID=A0A166A099_EXIGL|nr:kinase-like protein [Exidia glandulosa HHB12029]
MAPLKDRARDVDTDHQVGSKRKRVPSGTENYHPPPRAARGTHAARFKRQKQLPESEDDSEMDLDDNQRQQADYSDRDTDDDDEPELSSSDDYLVNHAPTSKLSRLRRTELVRLAGLAGIDDENDIDTLTKTQIVDAIVSARDSESIPPTPGTHEPPTSPSSDDGNDGGGEETDAAANGRYPLGRRSTEPSLSERPFRPIKGRSFSLGLLGSAKTATKTRARLLGRTQNGTARRYASQNNLGLWRSSPSESVLSRIAPPSPPATRTRQRDNSRKNNNGKHVGFKEAVEAIVTTEEEGEDDDEDDARYQVDKTPMPRRQLQMPKLPDAQPSPRRTRSKAKATESSDSGRRAVPPRKAKTKIGNLAESETNDEDDDEEGTEQAESATEEDEEEQTMEEQEQDELESSRSPSPPPTTPVRGRGRRGRRRPAPQPSSNTSDSRSPPETAKRRLRPRGAQTYTPPSDGDDEEEEEDEEQQEDAIAEDDEAEQEEGDESVTESVEEDEEDVDAMEDTEEEEDRLNAKVLRNGKTVGDVPMDEDAEAVESESVGSADETADSEEVEAEEDAEMDDDIDLEGATAKSLARLKRDDLVRMCETRDLDVEGTKPQLVDALLQWREHQQSVHSPSSTSTARPPSTAMPRARGRGGKNGKGPTPVLLRDKYAHTDEPRTPPVSDSERAKTIGGHKEEGELELDLESLGLEDREIPPDKLVKLEKIGSGGFKDVFVGKLRGRMKVAIAEFRGQLSAMDVKELKLLSDFDHPNVVRFLGVCVPENIRDTPVAMVSELCANGDLFDYIRNVPPPSLLKVLNIALDVARGIEYLHCRKPSVIHRDCKSSNILITSKGTAKIADFGLAKVKQSTRSMVVSLVGTVNWQAPELWHPQPKYNHKVDVFSCAMVYWEMLQWHLPQKQFPWEGKNEHAIYDLVGAKKQRPSVSGMRKQWCPEFVDLIERMWAQDPSDRPTMSEVVRQLEATIRQYK